MENFTLDNTLKLSSRDEIYKDVICASRDIE